MPTYAYKAISEAGTKISGMIEADSIEMAENLLISNGYIPSKISESKSKTSSGIKTLINSILGRVTSSELILFTKQFRTLLHAGVPILRIFQILEAQSQNTTLKKAINMMAQDVREGSTIYESMSKFPKIFSPLYLSMILAGEVSGTIVEVLERLTTIIEHEAKVKSDIKSAMQYPIVVLVFLSIAFFTLETFVIPRFIGVFSKVGIALPIPTKIAWLLYQFLLNYWYILLLAVVASIIVLYYYVQTSLGRYNKDALLLRLPLFGPLFIKAAMSRFASIFAILQASGVPVMKAMEVLSGTIGNTAISKQFNKIQDQIREGQGISAPLKGAKYFPPMVIDMVAIGEESGNIEDMMRAISSHYDDEVSYAVKRLSDALGPILVVCLAAVVGFFALAIFLPMWDLTKIVTH